MVYIDFILGAIILAIIFYRLGFVKGIKQGKSASLKDQFRTGYRKGVQEMKYEIRELLKLPEEEVLDRLRNIENNGINESRG